MTKKKFQSKTKGKKPTKINPFELHINNTKLHVLGQKNINDRGKPGVARAKAKKIRENTILDEYKKRHKNNVFKDRRIGEKNPLMDPEKKIALRMATEMRRQLSKKSLYNLKDDDDNGGLAEDTLTLNEKFEFSDEDDEDPQENQLDYKYVKAQHFGGGSFLKKPGEGEEGENGEKKFKSKKERIEEIIAESKLAKANKKRDKEEIEDAVKDLDLDLQKFMSLTNAQGITDEDKEKAKDQNEYKDYDMLTRELLIDRSKRAMATNRLKTPEEIAKEESEQLKALELARMKRMAGEEPDQVKKSVGRSADDLDDGFVLEGDERKILIYDKDGKLEDTKLFDAIHTDQPMEQDLPDQEDDVPVCEDDESDDSEDDESDNYSDILDEDNTDDENEVDDQEEETENINSEEDDDSYYSEIEGDKSESLKENTNTKKDKKQIKSISKLSEEDLKKKKEIINAAKKEIPYTFEVPQEYQAFHALLEHRSPQEVAIIIPRMITSNHPSLGNNNTAKCQDIFKYLLQVIHLMCEHDAITFKDGIEPLSYIDAVIPSLFTLCQLSASVSSDSLSSVIEEKYTEYSDSKTKKYPSSSCFIFLKISGLLFPSSDYQHVVMTSVMSFLTQMLGQCKLNTRREFTAALFTSSLLYEYIHSSKRFIPELWNTLQGFVFLSIPGKGKTKLPFTGTPFKIVGPQAVLLQLDHEVEQYTPCKLSLKNLNEEHEFNNDFKITLFNESITLLLKLVDLWKDLPSIYSIVTPLLKLLDVLSIDYYPYSVEENVEKLKDTIYKLPKLLTFLRRKIMKAKSLKMLEPSIKTIVGFGKVRVGDSAFREKQKLTHKYKQERKNAQKALRNDAAFMAKHKLKDILASDAERKRKVNKLLSELQYQESDYKKMKKTKF